LLLAASAGIALVSRSFTPLDETRYLSVAWEMWQGESFIVPLLNGLPYSHKPPLLFWLIHGGWAVFGVNDWWPRLISPVFAFLSLLLCRSIALRLWPERPDVVRAAPMVLLGGALWIGFSQLLMFDMLLGFWVLLGARALVELVHTADWRWWGVLGLALGLGGLTKGPVVLLHLLPLALLAPWWAAKRPALGRWYAGVIGALLLGAGIALAWAIPAALAGGEEYRNAIFMGQTLDRLSGPAPHQRPVWWYLPMLPVLLFPWLVWPPVYRGFSQLRLQMEPGVRLAISWALPTLIGFTLVSGKQLQYLLPTLPAWSLLIARSLQTVDKKQRPWLPALLVPGVAVTLVYLGVFQSDRLHGLAPSLWLLPGILAVAALWLLARPDYPRRQITALTLGMLVVQWMMMVWVIRPLSPAYDVRPIARAISEQRAAGRAVVHMGRYAAQYQFAGRLTEPLEVVTGKDIETWVKAHPDGMAVVYIEQQEELHGVKPLVMQPYRGNVALLLTAADALRQIEARTLP
jgi:4-amino-4-deoxy-L-arabinose transferase-like glycosyltransferase